MKSLPLRALNKTQQRISQLKRHLRYLGYDVSESLPPPMAVLNTAQTASGAQILVDLRAWCYREMEDLCGFANGYLSIDDIRHLYHYSDSSMDIFSGTPLQERLFVGDEVPADQLQNHAAMLSVNTSWGPVWISAIDDDFIKHVKRECYRFTPLYIPLPVSLVIGESHISCRYLRRARVGDVLLIEKILNVLKTGSYRLGKYNYYEENAVIEELYEYPATEHDLHEEYLSERNDKPADITRVPVRLEFVIHEKTMTFGDLSQWSECDVLPVNEAERGVLIKANGVIIGKGELVDLNGRIAVEIQELNRDVVDGK